MILNVLERITLLQILPQQGDFATLQTAKSLAKELDFNTEELDALNFQQTSERIQWKAENDPKKDCKIGEKGNDLIVEQLKSLNEKKQLTAQHFDLYQKFVVDKNE